MNRSWPILAVPLVLILAFSMANVEAITTGWKASQYVPISQPKEKIKSIYAAIHARSEARDDIRKGHLTLKSWGLQPMNTYTYEEVLRHRLGVTSKTVAGCVVWPSQVAAWTTYDEEMEKEIERRFGTHAIEKANAEAHALTAARDSGQAWFEAFKFAGDGARDCGIAYDAASYTRVYDCSARMLAAKTPFYCRFERWIDRDPLEGPTAVYAYDGRTLVSLPNGSGTPATPVRATPRLRGMRTSGGQTVLFGVALN